MSQCRSPRLCVSAICFLQHPKDPRVRVNSPAISAPALPLATRGYSLPVKLLLLRTCVALAGASLIAAAFWADSRTLALAGAISLFAAEALALGALRAAHESPSERALLGVCEAASGLAISLLEPAAMLAALGQIVYSVIASGMATVSASLGKPLSKPRSEWLRRLLGAAANAGLCLIALQAAGVLETRAKLGLATRDLALLCMALVIVASARTITELALSAKWTK